MHELNLLYLIRLEKVNLDAMPVSIFSVTNWDLYLEFIPLPPLSESGYHRQAIYITTCYITKQSELMIYFSSEDT